ncbi:MAG TPA: DNA methyltransferase, partial [Ktedonobacteraceae bacterium]
MSTDRLIARKHAEWLSLIEISGPFLSMPILLESFPQGLDLNDDESQVRRRVRLAYDEWIENQQSLRPDPAIHTQWLRFVLEEALQMRPDTILEGQHIPAELCYEAKERGETLRPLMVIHSPYEPKPRLLIQLAAHKQDLSKPIDGKQRNGSPATRMMELLRQSSVRLGLLTNGRQWMLIDAPTNETTGYYSWDASLWAEEPLTLQAFRSLLGMQRFFNVPADETLEALLTRSALKQQEVTDQLGDQVRHAVETLVYTLDQLDKEDRRIKKDQPSLLTGITEKELYEAALTVMMRLVFLLSAEERDLLQLGEQLYDQNYAVSTLLKQLQEQADQQGEDVMGYRCDAWSRLLAVFRMVYGGVDHADLHLPAYGGRLFDPDRFPFLEGRLTGTCWQDTSACPLKIDNRTVLHLLNALQYLQVRVGGIVEPRRLSFRGLDIEQIGHVYEGLLDHTARRAQTTILGLIGTSDSEPEATLEELEPRANKGEQELLTYLEEITGRKAATIQKNLSQALEKQTERSKLMGACDNKRELFERILPFAGLLRKDTFGNYVIITPGSIYVTRGDDRRSTGTHYTPRSLTEPIVQHALDPLVYLGPAEGWPREQWQLRTAAEILDLKICDMAMGSGAFLVQTCRYLSEKLLEAWDNAERDLNGQREQNDHPPKPQITPGGKLSQDESLEELVPLDPEERLAVAHRLVSERCLYGVDKNPMAAEMAKLSLWLITMAKHKPFTFLDHNLRCGDSLLGVNERQLSNNSLDAKAGETTQITRISSVIQYVLPTVIQKRRQIAMLPDLDITTIQQKERLLKEADQALEIVKLGADILIGIALSDPKRRQGLEGTLGLEYTVLAKAFDEALHQRQTDFGWAAKNEEFARLRAEVDTLLKGRHPFHWPLEFPEVFVGKGDDAGFAAIVGNPPFQGGSKITGVLGTDYRDYLVKYLANGKRGNADLCAYFFLQATKLARQEAMCALLATNTIAQGDTREVGLDQITEYGWVIPRALPSQTWPGDAGLEVAHVWMRHGQWHSTYILEDQAVENITPFLTAIGRVHGKPYKLNTNSDKSFNGSKIDGMGFVLDPEEAHELIARNTRNKDILFPFLNGDDLNSRPDQSSSRWTINFREWPLELAETYSDCIQILRERVKPERELKSEKKLRDKWWIYKRSTQALYTAIADMKRVLAVPLHSKYIICAWEPVNIVYSHALAIIATESNADFVLIQSTFHEDWTRANGSTIREFPRYTPSDCFETFPFPLNMDSLEDIGERYHTHRQSIMLANQEGLTKTYNRFHDPSVDIVKLRELHKEMDQAVAHAYGWDDLELEHGFHETKQGLRYTISEAARREVLDRLLLLNHERHEEEVAQGLHEKGA